MYNTTNQEKPMKVIDHIKNAKSTLFSFEIIPPPRGRSVQDIVDIVEKLEPYNPSWIDVTAHSASAYYNELDDGNIKRRIFKNQTIKRSKNYWLFTHDYSNSCIDRNIGCSRS